MSLQGSLTPYQKSRLDLVNRFPVGTDQDFLSNPTSLSSNNGPHVEPGNNSQEELPHEGLFLSGPDSELPKGQKRDWLKSQLRSVQRPWDDFRGGSVWPWVHNLLEHVADERVPASTWNEWRPFNFLRCFSASQRAEVVYRDGQPQVRKYSCSESLCPWCRTKRREQVAEDYLQMAREVYEKGYCSRAWSLVWTVPQELEGQISKEQAAEIRKGIQGAIRRAFGLRQKDKPNIAFVCVEHPGSDSDILRNRTHWHTIIFPVVMDKDNSPLSVDVDGLLDPDQLRAEWKSILQKIVDGGSDPIPPEAKYFQLGTKKGWSKFAHRVRYDTRSMWGDVENAVLYHRQGHEVVTRGKYAETREEFYRLLPVEALADRWIEIVDRNKVQPYGWLRNLKKWRELGYLDQVEEEQEEEQEDEAVVPARLHSVRRRVRESEGKYKWIRCEVVVWDPGDGRRVDIVGGDIPWLGGEMKAVSPLTRRTVDNLERKGVL